MAFNERNLDDYVDVAERIQEFYAKYPEGSLQPADPASAWEFATAQGFDKNGEQAAQTFVVYVAAAYRTPDDKRPGIGVAWEIWPGRTSYTRGSEVMNAETSAWGRAIAALGIATKKGIASRQEMANRRHERGDGLPVNADGSLSRSRTSDAEKDAAGVMTARQLAEHTALGGGHPNERKMPKAERAKVTRIRPDADGNVPIDDPPGWAPPGNLEDRPGSIGPRQRSQIMAAYAKLDRSARLLALTQIAGRELSSTNDLSYMEAARVLAELGAVK